jgi:hypothetical protein
MSEPAKPSEELQYITAMLEAASEHRLEAEVVWALCDIIRTDPHTTTKEATFQALAEWDC